MGSCEVSMTKAADSETWQLDLLFDLGFYAWLIHVGVVSLVAAMLIGVDPGKPWPIVWWGLMLVLSGALATISRAYVSRRPVVPDLATRLGLLHSAFTAAVGLTWGAGALAISAGSFEHLLIYSLALGGTALGAVSSQHALLRSCMLSLWTSVPMLSIAHLIHDPGFFGAVNAGMVLLYTAILSVLTIRMHSFMRTNVMLNRSLDAKVTELVETSKTLEAARKVADEASLSKSRFLAQASHDLRQPVHAIGLFTASLREESLNPPQRQLVESIDRSLQSLSRLFRSLLDVSALDVGRVQVQPEPVALGDIIADVVRQNGEIAREAGCELRTVGTRLWVETDPGLLANMLQNVVSNAMKYAPGSKIVVGCRRRGGSVGITVADRGEGIGKEHLDLVFEEFYRIGNVGTRTTEGLGLGLSIVRRLGKLMGLSVRIASSPGRGTAVSMDGFAIVERPRNKRIRKAAYNHPLRGRHVLLIDDNDDVLEATSILLERWGCIVAPVTSVPSRPHQCDTIVCDLNLGGGMGGLAAIEAVRALEGWPVPAIILSGRSEAAALDVIEAAGIPYLAKPVRPAELRGVLTGIAITVTKREPRRKS